MNVSPEARPTAAEALAHCWVADSDPATVCTGEGPVVSLHKVDRFFEREDSDLGIGSLERPPSAGSHDFARETRLITQGRPAGASPSVVRSSLSMRTKVTLSQGANYGGVIPMEETRAWRKVLHMKAKAVPSMIVRPSPMRKAQSERAIDHFKIATDTFM
jgi:hypothetical protein